MGSSHCWTKVDVQLKRNCIGRKRHKFSFFSIFLPKKTGLIYCCVETNDMSEKEGRQKNVGGAKNCCFCEKTITFVLFLASDGGSSGLALFLGPSEQGFKSRLSYSCPSNIAKNIGIAVRQTVSFQIPCLVIQMLKVLSS